MSSFLAGAEMITFLAPALMCALGLVGVGEEPGRFDDEVDACGLSRGCFGGRFSALDG